MREVRLLKAIILLTLAAFLATPAVLGVQKKSPAASKKGAPAKSKGASTPGKNSTAARKSTAKKSVSKGRRTAGSSKSRSRRGRQTASRSRTQQTPEPERIREIQNALAERGYDVEPTGVWDTRSVGALKKFQDDNEINNLTGRGKLDSLTLIALGLGPKHGAGAEDAKPNSEGKQP